MKPTSSSPVAGLIATHPTTVIGRGHRRGLGTAIDTTICGMGPPHLTLCIRVCGAKVS